MAQSSAEMKIFKSSSAFGLVIRSNLLTARDFDDRSSSAVLIGGVKAASSCTRAFSSFVPDRTKLLSEVDEEDEDAAIDN